MRSWGSIAKNMTEQEKQAFEEVEKQIKECNLSFAYIQGMQHCLDIFRYYLVYTDNETKARKNNGCKIV